MFLFFLFGILGTVLLVRAVRKAKVPNAGPYRGLLEFFLAVLFVALAAWQVK